MLVAHHPIEGQGWMLSIMHRGDRGAMSATSGKRQNEYYINVESGAETARLVDQARFLVKALGGPYPQRLDLSGARAILDIGCGPGRWAIDVARLCPKATVIGIDINHTMIEYAAAEAQVQQISNAHFLTMDMRQPLNFPHNIFDLVNVRLLLGTLSSSAWPQLVKECYRVVRPGGILLMTESEAPITNSPHFEKACELILQAIQQAHLGFSPDARHLGITPMLGHFMRGAGFQHIEQQAYAINFSFGTEEHHRVMRDLEVFTELIKPFVISMNVVSPEDLRRITLEANRESMTPDFCGIRYYLSVWGIKPASASDAMVTEAIRPMLQ